MVLLQLPEPVEPLHGLVLLCVIGVLTSNWQVAGHADQSDQRPTAPEIQQNIFVNFPHCTVYW